MEETNDLLKRLNNSKNLEALSEYLEKIDSTDSCLLNEHIKELMKSRQINSSELIRRSRIERTYCYQILNGRKKPGRDKLISIALALNLELNETQRLLEIAKEGVLYVKSKRGSILIFAINQKMSVLDTNFLLTQYEEAELK